MNAVTGTSPAEAGHTPGPADTFAVTFFKSVGATAKQESVFTLPSLASRILATTATKKDRLPWLKLARFGDVRTEKDALRHDDNLLEISGVEADYDGGKIAFDDAVEIATRAGLRCLIYTSPSHTEAAPRWRVLCPTSASFARDWRDKLLGRLNGLYGGVFSGESWTLSQSYFFGSVSHNPAHRVEVIDGEPIDELDDLDRIWMGKPHTTVGSTRAGDGANANGGEMPRQGRADEPALLKEIISGAGFHQASVRLLGLWARNGVPLMEARTRLVAAFEAVPEADRDARWKRRHTDVDRCVGDIYGKEAKAKDEGRRGPPPRPDASPPPGQPQQEQDGELPQLQVIASNLPATARELRDKLAAGGGLYDRGGVLVRLVQPADSGPPTAVELTPNNVVCEARRLCQPVAWVQDTLKPVTLPERVAKMFLDLRGEWNVPALDGITTAPVLTDDGAILDRDGYDAGARLWCAKVPAVDVPDRPTREDAERALARLRRGLRTFPFGDAPRKDVEEDGGKLSVVDTTQRAMLDETAALAGLLTAVCRPSLHLAPGLLVTAPSISGAGAGKGLLVRALSAIAFGTPPRAFTAGSEKGELDKRLVAELIEAAPAVFLDNVNNTALKSDLLASVLTERPARVRILGKSRMVPLNSTAWIAVTGNGLSVSEDLARRFLSCNLDAQMEDPESRPFAPGFLSRVQAARPAALAAALTVWRWGRQNPKELTRGRRLGSFEQWAEWVRDPLLTLGCADPVDRILEAKASDPQRKRVAELFEAWFDGHHTIKIKAKDLKDDVREIADPAGRGRQFLSSYLDKLDGTRAAGFVFRRYPPNGKWGTSLFGVEIADVETVQKNAEARRTAREEARPQHADADGEDHWSR